MDLPSKSGEGGHFLGQVHKDLAHDQLVWDSLINISSFYFIFSLFSLTKHSLITYAFSSHGVSVNLDWQNPLCKSCN